MEVFEFGKFSINGILRIYFQDFSVLLLLGSKCISIKKKYQVLFWGGEEGVLR